MKARQVISSTALLLVSAVNDRTRLVLKYGPDAFPYQCCGERRAAKFILNNAVEDGAANLVKEEVNKWVKHYKKFEGFAGFPSEKSREAERIDHCAGCGSDCCNSSVCRKAVPV